MAVNGQVLRTAAAVGRAGHDVGVEIGAGANRPPAYAERVAALRRTFNVVTFMPASMELPLAGQH